MATKSAPEPENSAEVATPHIEWGKVDTLDDARRILESTYGAILDSSRIFGDGSEFIKDKERLVNVPFLVLEWKFITDEKTGNEYVNVLIMNGQGNKARFNDGSTGVYAQLKQVTQEYGVIGLQVKNGLRKSEYDKEVDGKMQKAVTYYLSA